MSNLSTLNNQFEFNLPIDFVPKIVEDRFMPLLKGKKKIYRSVLDYLNSNILSISDPAIKFETVSNPQNLKRKKLKWKTVGNIYDLFDDTITVTFNSVDSNMNYLLMREILINHYLNTDTAYDQIIVVTLVDENRKAIYRITYRDVIWTGIGDNTFANNDTLISNKQFTCTFEYNYYDIEFVLGEIDVIRNE